MSPFGTGMHVQRLDYLNATFHKGDVHYLLAEDALKLTFSLPLMALREAQKVR
ncbi:hypothetical protein [Sphingobacterium sp. CZ-UAM]|uniref:hypothetical protein n=1 Tax=Sphingobacterium sp. CZ-UAM TaxID=1933868 RepID=UPI00158C54E4|nr:hypothetical protein [Sphingobacterium sp. CZ-UAM]